MSPVEPASISDKALIVRQASEDVRGNSRCLDRKSKGDQRGAAISGRSRPRPLFALNMFYLMGPAGQPESVVSLIV